MRSAAQCQICKQMLTENGRVKLAEAMKRHASVEHPEQYKKFFSYKTEMESAHAKDTQDLIGLAKIICKDYELLTGKI